MRIYVERPAKKPGRFAGEWLKAETTRDEMATEAQALLADPRDTIIAVKIFNDRWGQFEPVTFGPGWSLDGTRKVTTWQNVPTAASTTAPSTTKPICTTAPVAATASTAARGVGRMKAIATVHSRRIIKEKKSDE